MFIAGGVNVVAACCYLVVQVFGAVLGAAFVFVCYYSGITFMYIKPADFTTCCIYFTLMQTFDTHFTNTTSAAENVSTVGQILEVASTKLADGVSPFQVGVLMAFHVFKVLNMSCMIAYLVFFFPCREFSLRCC